MLVGAFIAHNADADLMSGRTAKYCQQLCSELRSPVSLKQTLVVGIQLLTHDSVGILEDLELLARRPHR